MFTHFRSFSRKHNRKIVVSRDRRLYQAKKEIDTYTIPKDESARTLFIHKLKIMFEMVIVLEVS